MSENEQVFSMIDPVEQPPRRVVSLGPSLTESLFDLNLGQRIIAITESCIHPTDCLRTLPRFGPPDSPNIEGIIALQPDLVMVSSDLNRLDDIEALRVAGLPVWITRPRSVQEALNLLWEIMDVFDEPSMSERVRWIERQMDWTAAVARENQRTRIFYAVSCEPWTTFAGQSFADDLLHICGGASIAAAAEDSSSPAPVDAIERGFQKRALEPEEIILAQPDVVFLLDGPYPFTEKHMQMIRALETPASIMNRIHLVDGTLLTWPGTRIAYALSEIPPLLSM